MGIPQDRRLRRHPWRRRCWSAFLKAAAGGSLCRERTTSCQVGAEAASDQEGAPEVQVPRGWFGSPSSRAWGHMASLHGKHGPVFLSANHQVSVLSDISSDSLAHEKAGFFFFFGKSKCLYKAEILVDCFHDCLNWIKLHKNYLPESSRLPESKLTQGLIPVAPRTVMHLSVFILFLR